MSVKWIEGFDIDYNSTNWPRKYAAVANASYSTAAGRVTGLCAAALNPGTSWTTFSLGLFRTWIFGIAIKPATIDSEVKIATLQNDGNEQISLWMVPGTSGKTKFRIKRGSTTLGTSTHQFTNGFWAYVEVKVTLDTDGTDGSVELRVNTDTEILVTGADTTNYNTDRHADSMNFNLSTNNGQFFFDDIYIANDQDGINDDFLGDRMVEAMLADGNGSTQQWTPNTGSHYSRVNEGVADDDTSYVSIAIDDPGKIELFTFSDITTITTEINAVQVTHSARIDASGEAAYRLRFKNGGDVANGPDQSVTMIDGYTWFTEIYNEDPTISGPWTVENFNAMEFGIESRTP